MFAEETRRLNLIFHARFLNSPVHTKPFLKVSRRWQQMFSQKIQNELTHHWFVYDELFNLNHWMEKGAPGWQNPAMAKPRDARLDALRGMFLVVMAAVHVPTPLSHWLQDPFGCSGAAEGFIFLSACLAGRVYGKTFHQAGWTAMARRIWKRSRLIYFVHLGVLIPSTLVIWALAAKMPPLANHFSDFLVHPFGSLALMPLLMHQSPLFDILPLYVIFLAATPWLLQFASRHGWSVLLATSALVWLAAQFGWDARLLGDPAHLLPLRWGAFDFTAWQLLWMGGVAIGEKSIRGPILGPVGRLIIGTLALALVLVGLYWRWGFQPPASLNPDIYRLMDKWTLGPLRLLGFGAWVALFIGWNPHPPARLLAPLALLGRHSLGVFAFHLPLVIAATTVIQMLALSNARQTVIGLLVVGLLFPWAAFLEFLKIRRAKIAVNNSSPTVKKTLPLAQSMR
jgi:hypothetical protein